MTTSHDIDSLNKACERSITKMRDSDALTHIGCLIDDAFGASFERGAKRALHLLDELSKRDLIDTDGALSEYFRANAWAALSHIANNRRSWSWEAPERQEELLALSRASNHVGFWGLEKIRQCQILTNYANLLNMVGRTIDAVAVWDSALKVIPDFAMACGNRGCGLKTYAGMASNNRERAILALHAFDSLHSAISEDSIWDSIDPRAALKYFSDEAENISIRVNIDAVRAMQNLDFGREGRSNDERNYRQWCLKHRLFLRPLNDLGPHLAAATDTLMLPPLIEGLNERPNGHLPPPVMGFFSQMKQEYVSARYMLYEGISSTKIHFSDRGVSLTDTLDYPLYSLASERVRSAFRIAYSLLDKTAFLVDNYWNLGKKPERISFKNVWMIENKARLLPQFEGHDNLPLRGLYWLSKELFDEDIKQTTAVDARELHSIRNALEHAYLRVTEGWAKVFTINESNNNGFGISIGSDELEAKAIRIMKIARSALLYLSFAIGAEEQKKRQANPSQFIVSMPLYSLDEKRKRRDPCLINPNALK